MESVSGTVAAKEDTRYEEVINGIQQALERLEKSSYFSKFMKQMRNPKIVAEIKRVIARDQQYSQLQLVLYGVGEMKRSSYRVDVDSWQMQLAFAILLKQKFQWVNDIVVYDPSVGPLQQKAIRAFNCTFLSVNEYGRRTVDRPTLFFMPHCSAVLYNNVLSANWTTVNLNKIIILGNSFRAIKKDATDGCKSIFALKHLMAILYSNNILREMPLPEPEICEPTALYADGVYKRAFSEFSWHFFPSDKPAFRLFRCLFFPSDGSVEDLNLGLFPEIVQSSSHLDLY